MFIASINAGDIPWADLQDITVEIFHDPQHATSRRSQLKPIVHIPTDPPTSPAQMLSTGQISVDVKRTVNIRDSGFLDDEDGQSGRDGELMASRGTQIKQTEPVSEDTPTPTDLINRKMKSKIEESVCNAC